MTIKRKIFFLFLVNFVILFFVEQLSPIWPKFDLEKRSGHKISNIGQYKLPKVENEVCSVIFYSMTINSDGTVSACCSDWNQEIIIGDLKNESLMQIWQSNVLKKLQKLHLQKKRKKTIAPVQVATTQTPHK